MIPSGAQCKNGMCECASEEFTYVRGQCRRLVNLNSECRDVTLWTQLNIRKIDTYFHFRKLIVSSGIIGSQLFARKRNVSVQVDFIRDSITFAEENLAVS